MIDIDSFLIGFLLMLWLIGIVRSWVMTYKIAYYETRLKNRGVDISDTEALTFVGLIKKLRSE